METLITIKDSLLINNGLPNNFWVEVMEIANYLQNCLPIKTKGHGELILEENWSSRRQNFSHIKVFCSKVLVNIPKKKKNKSNYQHIWKGIFIGFNSNSTKHY